MVLVAMYLGTMPLVSNACSVQSLRRWAILDRSSVISNKLGACRWGYVGRIGEQADSKLKPQVRTKQQVEKPPRGKKMGVFDQIRKLLLYHD